MTNNMTPEAAEHFNGVVTLLAQCYEGENPQVEGVLVLQTDNKMLIVTANATDMTAHAMLKDACEVAERELVADAPPKDLFN